MHYLLIIKIKCRINKPEPKGTFVSSKARFPTFCYPRAWMFGAARREFLLGLTSHPIGWQDTEEEGGGRSCHGTYMSQCGVRKHLNLTQVQEEAACFWLVSVIRSDKQFLWSAAHRDISGSDRAFTGGSCVCVSALTCRVRKCEWAFLICGEGRILCVCLGVDMMIWILTGIWVVELQ